MITVAASSRKREDESTSVCLCVFMGHKHLFQSKNILQRVSFGVRMGSVVTRGLGTGHDISESPRKDRKGHSPRNTFVTPRRWSSFRPGQ